MSKIVSLLIPLLAVQSVVSVKFHIVTSPKSVCPGELAGEPCLTLQQYVSYPSRESNITLEFERGNHSLKSSFSISARDYFGLVATTNATINCDRLSSTSISFSSITNVDIKGISFIQCGTVGFSHVTNGTVVMSDFQMSTGTRALYLSYSSYVYVVNSTFSGNHGCQYGSAIYLNQVNSLTVIQTNFSNNSACYGGGAIYFDTSRSASFVMERCLFVNNTAVFSSGGAVYVSSSSSSTIIISTGNIYENNSAHDSGGAFFFNYASESTTFTDNSFISNRAVTNYGGALYVSGSRRVSIDRNTFMNNTARREGGAAYFSGITSTVNTANQFVNNTATGDGGAIYMSSGSIDNRGNYFINNRATDDGGALYMSGSSTNNNNSFINNTASNNGGALYASGSITDRESMFSSNKANSNGGALYVSGSFITIMINRSILIKNRVRNGGGGALYSPSYRVSMTISNSTFINNIGYVRGGALSVLGDRAALRINGSTFVNNLIAGRNGNGGAVYVEHANTRLIIVVNSIFINNTAINGTGGAIYAKKGFTITNTVFGYNKALLCAAVNVEQSNYIRSMTLVGSTFLHNTAVGSTVRGNIGGVGCIRNADISISSCTFSHNVATGGGVFNIEDSTITIERSMFKNNTAGVDGGVFYTRAFPSSYMINESIFMNNRAGDDGGVIYLGRGGSFVQLHGSSLSANAAVDRGGAVAIFGSAINITSTNMQNNMARSGADVSACNTDTMNTILINLSEQTDPQHDVCTLYDGSVQDFPEPLVRDDSNLDISAHFQAFVAIPDDQIVPVMAVTDATPTTTGQEVDPILEKIQSQLLGTSVVVYLLFSFFIIFVLALIVVMVVKYKRKKFNGMQQQSTVNRMTDTHASSPERYTESIELYEEPEWCAQGQSNTRPIQPNAGYVNQQRTIRPNAGYVSQQRTQHYVK